MHTTTSHLNPSDISSFPSLLAELTIWIVGELTGFSVVPPSMQYWCCHWTTLYHVINYSCMLLDCWQTPLVRGGHWCQWICLLPATGRQIVTVSETVEHLCHHLHSFLLHKHISTPLCYELPRLTGKQRWLHDVLYGEDLHININIFPQQSIENN